MSYKQQIKENELLTKLKIVKLAYSPQFTNKKVANAFGCHRNTVSNIKTKFHKLNQTTQKILLTQNNLALEEIKDYLSPLKNKSPEPWRHPGQATPFQEGLILWLFYGEKWRVGYSSMHTKIDRRFSDHEEIDVDLFLLTKLTVRQIRGVYSRCGLKVKKTRTKTGKSVPLYDYAALGAFQMMHYDVKILPDQKSLPPDVYHHLLKTKGVPKYQWTLIDAKTKFRFVAYSHNINSEFGLKFLLFCLMYIRFTFRNWETEIVVGIDNGTEFCRGSKRKLQMWNSILGLLNSKVYQYNPYFDVRKNIVERSHRTDDSHFLIPRGKLLTNKTSFLKEASGFYFYFNFQKHHTGQNMFNRTPYEALKDTGLPNPEKLVGFPVMILEDNIETLRKTTDLLLFKSELKQAQQKTNNELSLKQVLDASIKYSFFDNSAQKVLTKYRTAKSSACQLWKTTCILCIT
ncbi:MAG: hypothetical protein U9R15_08905 [Chloroflexota bacterium]|nr:hypothetical protein [Chloroflexota bacterium]